MLDNKPQGLIADGIALMRKGHLTSASALFNEAIAVGQSPLIAQLLNASCKNLSISHDISERTEVELLEEAISDLESALDQARDRADTIKEKLEAELESSKSDV